MMVFSLDVPGSAFSKCCHNWHILSQLRSRNQIAKHFVKSILLPLLSCTSAVMMGSGYSFMILQPTFQVLGRRQLANWSV